MVLSDDAYVALKLIGYRSIKNMTMKRGDYRDENGIPTCGVCNEPKVERIDVEGRESFWRARQCKCQRERQ